MAKRTNRVAWSVAAVLAVVLLGWASVPYAGQRLPITRPYVWVRVPHAVVSLDGKPAAVPVYRSHDGQLLLWMNVPYVIFPAGGSVEPVSAASLLLDWDDDNDNHFLITRRFALVTGPDLRPGVWGSYYEGDPHAAVHPGYVEFKAYYNSPRVRVCF